MVDGNKAMTSLARWMGKGRSLKKRRKSRKAPFYVILGPKVRRLKPYRGSKRQTGPTSVSRRADALKRAMRPGRRISRFGNVYYEHRHNRSD